MKKPIIGISSNILGLEKGLFAGYKRTYVDVSYINAVINAGGVPHILPMNEHEDIIKEFVKSVDGIILTGGNDVFPLLYGEEPKEKLGEIFPERDKFDSLLIRYAITYEKPIFGICRGMQIINVECGGSLYQDLSYDENVKIKHFQKARAHTPTHSISVATNCFLSDIYPEGIGFINSYHHQTINQLAPGFSTIAKSTDGVIEAIENISNKTFIIGVQWHPEMMAINDELAQKLFKKFINEVSLRKKD